MCVCLFVSVCRGREPAPIKNADMERVLFEEFRGQLKLDSLGVEGEGGWAEVIFEEIDSTGRYSFLIY